MPTCVRHDAPRALVTSTEAPPPSPTLSPLRQGLTCWRGLKGGGGNLPRRISMHCSISLVIMLSVFAWPRTGWRRCQVSTGYQCNAAYPPRHSRILAAPGAVGPTPAGHQCGRSISLDINVSVACPSSLWEVVPRVGLYNPPIHYTHPATAQAVCRHDQY